MPVTMTTRRPDSVYGVLRRLDKKGARVEAVASAAGYVVIVYRFPWYRRIFRREVLV